MESYGACGAHPPLSPVAGAFVPPTAGASGKRPPRRASPSDGASTTWSGSASRSQSPEPRGFGTLAGGYGADGAPSEVEKLRCIKATGRAPDGEKVMYAPDGEKIDLVGVGMFGPDGMPLGEGGKQVQKTLGGEMHVAIEGTDIHHGVDVGQLDEASWFRAEDCRAFEEMNAWRSLQALCEAVDRRHVAGSCPERRWTNDPAIFPEYDGLGVTPFPPEDRQLFVPPARSRPPPTKATVEDTSRDDPAEPFPFSETSPQRSSGRPWLRLIDFAQGGRVWGSNVCRVFTTLDDPDATFCGPVFQGQLDNAYFVEALNAVSLRPKLAQRLFHCWDVDRSIYMIRVFKNGMWVSTAIDDFVPAADPLPGVKGKSLPLCCRSQRFPFEMWPTLVEKAHAKICTVRPLSQDPSEDKGGWEALGGGGCVEEALADLTGGVAGRFSTRDMTPDRLFVYFHELQRESLFVCRVHVHSCRSKGVFLDPFKPHAVHRAALFEGMAYVLVYSPGGCAGLDQHNIPFELTRMFPEKPKDGFCWCNIVTFHQYFDTVIECRLTNCPDVGVALMPLPRLPVPLGLVPLQPAGVFTGLDYLNAAPPDPVPNAPYGVQKQPIFFEWVFANDGKVHGSRPPEFNLRLPAHPNLPPCEVIACLQQADTRLSQVGPERQEHVPILLKVYEQVTPRCYNEALVCKSNWLPVRDSMVAFQARFGGVFKVVARFPSAEHFVERLVFRCYVSVPGAMVSAGCSTMQGHKLVRPMRPSMGQKWTFVGCARPERVLSPDVPEILDDDLDTLKLRRDRGECSVM